MYKKIWKVILANSMANSEHIMCTMVEMATSGEHRNAMLATCNLASSNKKKSAAATQGGHQCRLSACSSK